MIGASDAFSPAVRLWIDRRQRPRIGRVQFTPPAGVLGVGLALAHVVERAFLAARRFIPAVKMDIGSARCGGRDIENRACHQDCSSNG